MSTSCHGFRYEPNFGHLDNILRTRRASLVGDFGVPDTEKVPWSGCTRTEELHAVSQRLDPPTLIHGLQHDPGHLRLKPLANRRPVQLFACSHQDSQHVPRGHRHVCWARLVRCMRGRYQLARTSPRCQIRGDGPWYVRSRLGRSSAPAPW